MYSDCLLYAVNTKKLNQTKKNLKPQQARMVVFLEEEKGV